MPINKIAPFSLLWVGIIGTGWTYGDFLLGRFSAVVPLGFAIAVLGVGLVDSYSKRSRVPFACAVVGGVAFCVLTFLNCRMPEGGFHEWIRMAAFIPVGGTFAIHARWSIG